MMGLGLLSLLHTLQVSLWDCVEWLAEWMISGSMSMHEVTGLAQVPSSCIVYDEGA